MTKIERKMIKETERKYLDYYWFDWYCGPYRGSDRYNESNEIPTIKDVRDYFDSLIEKYGEEARCTFSVFEDDYFGNTNDLMIYYGRQETEKEAQKRITRNKKMREAQRKRRAKERKEKEERERKELERLQKKYGEA